MTKDRVSDSASVRAVTYVNVEQAPKSEQCRSRPSSPTGEGHSRHSQGTQDPVDGPAGVRDDGTPQEEANATRETLIGGRCRPTSNPRGTGSAGQGVGKVHSTAEAG